MSDDYFDELQKESPIHEGLKDFVERAIADTVGLSTEQADAIREKVAYWYAYYGRSIGWFKLDFADTEETRRVHAFFRESLRDFVAGIDNLNHVFYSVEMVIICLLKEYTRVQIEERLKAEQQQSARSTASAAEEAPPSLHPIEQAPDEEQTAQPKSPKKKRAATAAPKVQAPAQPTSDQISLFG